MKEHSKTVVITTVSRGALAFALISVCLLTACGATTEYTFVCDDEGRGLSAVDVLEATGEHETFLALLREHDPEGYEVLADPVLADKTIWAPTDAAFSTVADLLSSLPSDEVKAVLGYHITPPRRTPDGFYPIITPEYLTDNDWLVHQTRTGILTGSDQRVLTRMRDGGLIVEDSEILSMSWCTQTGSVFAIDRVITQATPEPWLD